MRRTQAVLRIKAILLSEPRWLRGLDWRLVAVAGLVAAILHASIAVTVLFPDVGDQAPDLEFVLLDAWAQATMALLVLLLGVALVNLERPRLPVPLCLALAVLVGTLAPFLIVHDSQSEPLWRVLLFWRRDGVAWAIAAAAWCCLHRASESESALRRTEIARRSLTTAMLEARLRALQAQVEPHFLFNTLAHVRRLYRTDPAVARRMLESFASYLESAFAQMRERDSTLGREVDLVRAYLDVQQVRMGARLSVNIGVPDALREHRYPPMMLVSLVENAVKHGLDPLRSGGSIAIDASARDGALEVAVIDTGRGITDKIGSGVGLANIRTRLAALFGDAASVSLAPNLPGGVRAVIRTPLDASLGDVNVRATRDSHLEREALAAD